MSKWERVSPSNNWERVGEEEKPTNKKLFDYMNDGNKSLADLIPAAQQVKPGIKQGFQESLSALPFIGNKFPSPELQEEIPSDVPGAGGARMIGRMLGATPVVGAIGAPLAMGGAALGLPASVAEIAGVGTAGALTTLGDPFHRAVGGLAAAAPVGVMKFLVKSPQIAKTMLSKINPRELVNSVRSRHDVIEKEASNIFNEIKSLLPSRKINKIDIPKQVIEDASQALPKTEATLKLVNKAMSGDYEALFKLQSDLGKKANKKLASDLVSENNQGEEFLEVKDQILKHIQDTFNKSGHHDLSARLQAARTMWRGLKQTYYSHPRIAKMVGEERLVPTDPLKLFSEESTAMGKLHEAHPELPKAVKLKKEKDNINKLIKYFTGGAVSYTPTLAALKYLFGGEEKPSSQDFTNDITGNP